MFKSCMYQKVTLSFALALDDVEREEGVFREVVFPCGWVESFVVIVMPKH